MFLIVSGYNTMSVFKYRSGFRLFQIMQSIGLVAGFNIFFMVVNHLQRRRVNLIFDCLHGRSSPLFEHCNWLIAHVNPNKSTEINGAPKTPQTCIIFGEPFLVTFLFARNVNAVAAHIKLPSMKHAGDSFWVS